MQENDFARLSSNLIQMDRTFKRAGFRAKVQREMDWESDTAKEYRNRAEDLRATAERMADKKSRETRQYPTLGSVSV